MLTANSIFLGPRGSRPDCRTWPGHTLCWPCAPPASPGWETKQPLPRALPARLPFGSRKGNWSGKETPGAPRPAQPGHLRLVSFVHITHRSALGRSTGRKPRAQGLVHIKDLINVRQSHKTAVSTYEHTYSLSGLLRGPEASLPLSGRQCPVLQCESQYRV